MPITDATPPPAGTPRKSSAARVVSRVPLKEQRQDAITGIGQLMQVPLMATRQYADAGAVGVYWPNIAKEVAELADSQEAIAKLIDPLIKIGPYTGLVAAVLPFLMQIGVNHGRIPAGSMGTVPASTLAAQIETSIAHAELEALRSQMQAEKAAAAMREEIRDNREQMEKAMANAGD